MNGWYVGHDPEERVTAPGRRGFEWGRLERDSRARGSERVYALGLVGGGEPGVLGAGHLAELVHGYQLV